MARAAHEAPGRAEPEALSHLFADDQQVNAADEAAAARLATAFGQGGARGRPTRVAESELSLDHLFRDVPREPSGAVTLDAFFTSPGTSSGEARAAERSGADAPAPDTAQGDIEQFTAWLEGLKKK
jgi:hypothetical protein